ncbi:M23 family metallopeptidase [Sulfitobacter albidus]|uniref:M23 family metallopeptidase n=1 Tax=Sulfitobacter albidus TaxID=2829501 RepID=A0A975PLU5_9RHOB|nr:M23 family metallopeptidase [Sulfitobacter albidus]QUJ75545.1 M23 family metallopeptidase [Sulfitobacter albidus]
MRLTRPAGWVFCVLVGGAAQAQELTLVTPIDCDLNGPCHIQQYVDHDAGAGASDFRCNAQTYDGHKGTDFALPTTAMIDDGIDVLAAAGGTVRGLRDGMPDSGLSTATEAEIAGRECGNGVVLTHPGGWETQYCHLRAGSITVTRGQRVAAGEVLGEVGMSGSAEFAHLHLSVRRDGAVVDPYDPDGVITCGAPSTQTLWADPPATRPGGIIAMGTAAGVPEFADIKRGVVPPAQPGSAAMVIWSYLFGTREGDVLYLSLTGPEGFKADRRILLDRTQAQSFRAIGKRLRADRWPAGDYVGVAELRRGGDVIERREITRTLP